MYLEFTPNGDFLQKTGEGKEQVVSKMSFRVDKNKILYKGRATANEEFELDYHFNGDKLILAAEGNSTAYMRIK